MPITSLTLINANTGLPIRQLVDNAIIDIAQDGPNLSIRANTSGTPTTASVQFRLRGAQSITFTDSSVPFSLLGNTGTAYNPWIPINGSYSLTVRPFTGINGTGTRGSRTFITFTVINANVVIPPDPPVNIPPTVNAGTDISITLPTNLVVLNAIASDSDGTIVSRLWSKTAGPTSFTIASPTAAQTTVSGLVAGTYTFNHRVTDDDGAVANDTVNVVVNPVIIPPNVAPVANAGVNQTITLPTNFVNLAGTGTDSDGTIVSRSWSQINGPSTASLSSTTLANIVASALIAGVYTFRFRVVDDDGAAGTDDMTVTVNSAPVVNLAPIADAGANKAITLPINLISLSGANSRDTDGTIVAYSWTQVSGPTGAAPATFSHPNSSATNVTNFVAGTYVFRLTVIDNQGATGSDDVTLTVFPAINLPPTANAGSDVTITLPSNSVTLIGSGTDPEGGVLTYQWTKLSGGNAVISTPTMAQTTVTGLTAGSYSFEFKVTDNKGAIATDNVTVSVNAVPVNQAPIANAGTDITLTLPTNSTTLAGTGTDADGTITGYAWTRVSGPATFTLVSANAATTALNNLVQGTYVFRLTVTDNSGATATDDVTVTVNAALNTYYVSAAGNDANNGTSTSTPWRTISKINSSTFLPGSSILFRRGDMWREQLTIPSSGTSGSPIVFGAYGTGAKPIINGANVMTGWTNAGSNRWYIISPNAVATRAMVIIDGVIYEEAASVAALTSANKYFIDVSTTPARLYVFSTVDPSTLTAEVSNREYCIVTAAGANSKRFIEVNDIEVRYAGRAGIYFEGPGSNISNALNGSSIVRRCTAYANRLFGMVHIDHYDNVLFEDCNATYNGNGFYSWVADEGTFRKCVTSDQIHYESISAFTDGGGVQGYQADNWLAEYCVSNRDYDAIHLDCGGVACHGTIRYNKVYDSRHGSPNTPCMGIGSLGAGGRIDIYYNLLVNGASGCMESYSTMNDQVHFYNNTCYVSATDGTDSILGNYANGANWNIKNNIFVREYVAGEYNMINAGSLPTTMDNNLYYIYNPVSGTLRNFFGTAHTTLNAWQVATGKDLNSLSVDPLFVNKASDWSLQTGSPCKNAGVNVGLTKDILGNTVTGTPSIGAYQ